MGVIVDKWHADAAVIARLAAPRRITVDNIGSHYLRYPGTNPKLDIPYGVVRNHDWSNAGEGTRWEQIHTGTGPDQFDWDGMDLWTDQHYGNGKTIIYCLMGTPAWAVAASAVGNVAAGYGTKANMVPDDLSKLTAFATAIVNRYKDRIHYWEGWNEPNLLTFYGGTSAYVASTATPAKLAEIQRVWHQAIKAADPTAVVLSPCFTSVFGGVAGWQNYLAASDGASGTGKDWFDIAAYHYYCNDASNRPTGLVRMHQGVVAAMTAAGISKPVWGTEWGLLSPTFRSYSVADQRALLRLYQLALLVLGVDVTIFYAFDDATIGLSPENVTAWAELMAQILGKTMTAGTISVLAQQYMEVRCEFSDGTVIVETWGPMP